jgi:hypothetical protein
VRTTCRIGADFGGGVIARGYRTSPAVTVARCAFQRSIERSNTMHLIPVYRVTVFVPPAHLAALKAGILSVDDLAIGDYCEVMWTSAPGLEQFRPGETTTPTLGVAGELTSAPSVRLEFSIPRDPERLRRVIVDGVHAHHPWEVPAVFVDESFFPMA